MGVDEDRFNHFLDGDEDAFRSLLGDYQGRVFAIILGRGCRGEEAEDLFQEVWRRVIEHGASFDPASCFRAWIDTITRNACADHLRAGRRLRLWMREFILAAGNGRSGRVDPLAQGADPGPDPLQPLVRNTLQEALAQCREGLADENQKKAVRLYVQGENQREMAGQLGVSLGTANAWFHRACALIRRCLEQKGWSGLDALEALSGEVRPPLD